MGLIQDNPIFGCSPRGSPGACLSIRTSPVTPVLVPSFTPEHSAAVVGSCDGDLRAQGGGGLWWLLPEVLELWSGETCAP